MSTSTSKPTSRIGGSILPSSDPQILKPMVGKHGTFLVRPVPDLDTYVLEFESTDGKYKPTLVMHPNGYTCHGVAERILKAWAGEREIDYVMRQFDHVLACGGLGIARGSIEHIVKGLPEHD